MPIVLQWFQPDDANEQLVYVSQDRQLVEDMNSLALEGNVASDVNEWEVQAANQQPEQTWYWRIVEVDGENQWAGPVIETKTADGKARDPIPEDGDVGIGVSPAGRLSWTTGGDWVTSHRVYVDANETKVTDANTSTTGLLVNNTTTNAYYNCGNLTLGETYYWRVDESGGAFFVKGDIWSFTLGNYYVIEDFEVYNTTTELTATTAWPDGGTNGSGAELTLLLEGGHESPQYMQFYFDNKEWEGNSYTERNFGSNQNWTVSGTSALVLYFSGNSTNRSSRVETMSITLTDDNSSDSQDYPGDPCNILIDEWFRWDIALSDFSGVDPEKINKMKISFKDERNGYGYVYFDEFRLYQPSCWPEKTGLKADFTGDCIVNADDLETIGIEWLKGDVYVTASDPGDANLVLEYDFDGTLNDPVPDGLVDGTSTYTAQIIAGSDPNSEIKYASPAIGSGTSAHFINVNSGTGVADTFVIPDACDPGSDGIDFNTFDEFTIALFLNPDVGAPAAARRICSEAVYVVMYLDPQGQLHSIRKYDGTDGSILLEDDFPLDTWSHLAMTWDADSADDRFKLYMNGELIGSIPGSAATTLDTVAGFTIGGYQRDSYDTAQPFFGKIDEFRLYDAALSNEEVAYLANNGPGTLHFPLDSEANLYPDTIVDFKDYAEFSLEWLIGPVLWP